MKEKIEHKIRNWQPKKRHLFILSLASFAFIFQVFEVAKNTVNVKSLFTFTNAELKNRVGKALVEESYLPPIIEKDGKSFELNYTLNQNLETHIKKLLKRYRSDYSAVVVIDNNSGNILSAIGFNKKENQFERSLAFTATHPAASLFKIITSAELLQNSGVDKDYNFSYRGRSTTLYKYQLRNKRTKWTRWQSLKSAFAVSNNAIFGKAAIEKIKGLGIFKMAKKFGFNETLMEEVPLQPSIVQMPESQYHLAELASGFNRETLISPVHGAVIASVIANLGNLKKPRLLKNISGDHERRPAWKLRSKDLRVLDEEVANELSDMMEFTVKRGTARSSFRRFIRKFKEKLEVGGKTGSITGGVPHGKRDWFAAYAKPTQNTKDLGISVCVMNVNVKKWYVKATTLAQKVIDYYYSELKKI